eukprot:gene29578-35705_t
MTPKKLHKFMIGLQFKSHKGEYNSNVTLLSQDDLDLPFVGREDALKQISQYYKGGIDAMSRDVSDRNKYPIPACAWIPGLGKTAMLHRGREILDHVGVEGRRLYVIVPYLDGHSLQWIDRELPIEEASFSWRLLYMVFLRSKGVNFLDLCDDAKLPVNCQALTLNLALKTVRRALRKDTNSPLGKGKKLLIFLGIDEFQKVAEGEELAIGKLSQLCQKLHDNRFNRQKTMMFPLFAGTDWDLIQASSNSSRLPVLRVSMPPLNMVQATQLFGAALGGNILLNSSVATHHLLIVGSLPRSLLNYCEAVKRNMKKDDVTVPSAIHLTNAYEQVLSQNRNVRNCPARLAKLIALCFTMEDVSNRTVIKYMRNNSVEETASVIKLSNSGLCLVSPTPAGGDGESDGDGEVTVPYMMVHLFSRCKENDMGTKAEKYLLRSVQWMVKNVDNVLYEKQPWQLFEDFGAAFNACRINAWQVLGYKTASLCDLWRGGTSNVSSELRVKLMPVSVVRSGDKLSRDTGDTVSELQHGSNNDITWRGSAVEPLKRGFVVINGENGEGVDSWVSLPLDRDPSQDVIIAEQSKHVAMSTVSYKDISDLVEKVVSVCPTRKQSTVVSCVRNPFPRLAPSFVNAAKMPDNVVVVVREHLESHFGMFHRHPAVSPHVDINTCGKERLGTMGMSMAGGKDKAAKLVFERRQKSKFDSMDDFQHFLVSKGISCDVAQLNRLYVGTSSNVMVVDGQVDEAPQGAEQQVGMEMAEEAEDRSSGVGYNGGEWEGELTTDFIEDEEENTEDGGRSLKKRKNHRKEKREKRKKPNELG